VGKYDQNKVKPKEEWIFIKQAANEIEANIIESIFDSEGIPVIKKYREAGEYLKIYMGMTNFGVDIYVPTKLKEVAETLLNEVDFEEE
jgi:hypothetical protein